MKMFIPLICILSFALAEPPVGDSYASALSSHDHEHNHDSQNSLSQEYGAPAASFGTARNALSTEYGTPNARTISSKSGLSQNYGAPNVRSGLSQEYGPPNARSSSSYSASSRGLSNKYGVPSGRTTPSQIYGAPTARNSASHSTASSRSNIARTPGSLYGTPEFRTPSEEYGAPTPSSFGRIPSQQYNLPTGRTSQTVSQEYGAPSARTGNFQSHTTPRNTAKFYGSSFGSSNSGYPKGSAQGFGSRTISTSYGTPATKNSYSQSAKALPQTYGAPSQKSLSNTYGVPSARDISQEYGAPSNYAANQKTNAIASSYTAAARSSPSDTYGVPSARDYMPSEQYGVPNQYDSLSDQGYSYARNALNEVLNQVCVYVDFCKIEGIHALACDVGIWIPYGEGVRINSEEPANYDFTYKVNDYETGSDFGHTETRLDNKAEGTYFVVLPDGTKQVVEYEADERGFKPRISVEPADLGRSGGYDDNASDLARSGDGPY